MENTTTEALKEVLNNGYSFTEQKVFSVKNILLRTDLREINLKDLMALDEGVYKKNKYKTLIYKNAIKKMGFNIVKRKKEFLRKRIIKNCLNYLPEYVFKTFWIIQLKQNGKHE